MSQQWAKPWVVRVVGPNEETEYMLVNFSDAKAAKERVENIVKANPKTAGWRVEDPVEPRQV